MNDRQPTTGTDASSLLSIIIPAFNEADAIGEHLERVLDWGRTHPSPIEILVVDDGSTDRTAQIVDGLASQEPRLRLLRQEVNRGKGAAVHRGLAEARGEIRGFTDADAATDIGELERVLPAFTGGAEIVIGSRARKATDVSVEATVHRRIIGRTFNGLLRALLDLRAADGSRIADSQCGFKWMTDRAAEALLPHVFVEGFAFDVELLYLANRLEIPVAEVPVNWTDRGTSSVNLLADPPKMLAASIEVVRRHRRL